MLFERLQLEFICEACEIDEARHEDETATDLVMRLSREKAEKISLSYPGSLIIGADQVAEMGDHILTKPGNLEMARQQLSSMRGQTLIFLTGVTVINTERQTINTECIPYRVTFRQFSDQEIDRYLDKEKPFDCAGSFKSEQLGISLLDKMEGTDPTALVGLPLIRLSEMLRQEGIKIP